VSRLPIRLRLTLTYVALLVVAMTLVLGASWVLLSRHLQRTVPAQYVDGVLAQLGSQYALALLGGALLALGIGWAAAGRALAPLGRIAATARRISEDRLDERVQLVDGPDDELRDLATAFDAMLDRVAAGVAAQGRFVANASHELRTPLTVIRTGAEVVLDDPNASAEDLRAVARDAVETTEHMEELLDGLLVLAALGGSEPHALRDEPVCLGAVTRRVVRAAQSEADAAGVSLHASLEAAPLRGDPALLERLVANLLENAIRHGEPGPVTIAARADADGARLRVVNGGQRIAPAHVVRLTQPFERLHRGRGRGSGLGLSIVRAVAEAHGGELCLTAPAAGGLSAEVRLPGAVMSR
jgi:signal transduction histidine kinase